MASGSESQDEAPPRLAEAPLARRLVPKCVLDHVLKQRRRAARQAENGTRPSTSGSSGNEAGRQQRSRSRGARGRTWGVIAILDISGFSALCEKAHTNDALMEAMQLCGIINGAFSKEIEVVQAYGGEALCFLGDGLLVLWPAEEVEGEPEEDRAGEEFPAGLSNPLYGGAGGGTGDGSQRSRLGSSQSGRALMPRGLSFLGGGRRSSSQNAPEPPPDIPELGTVQESTPREGRPPLRWRMGSLAARAAQCALQVQEVFSEACVGMGKDMKLRVAIAAGEFSEYFVGVGGASNSSEEGSDCALVDEDGNPVPGRMSQFIAGPGIEEAGDALGAIKPGEVAVCASALRWMPPPPPKGTSLRNRRAAHRSDSMVSNISNSSAEHNGSLTPGAAGGGGGGAGGMLGFLAPGPHHGHPNGGGGAPDPLGAELTPEEEEAVALYVFPKLSYKPSFGS
eukprot:tig00000042_g15624.t1